MMYREHLLTQLLPFWNRAFDELHGGIYTCYTNDGKTLVSRDKYTWSQGRMLWVLSHLLGSPTLAHLLNEEERSRYTERARLLHIFLDRHAFPAETGNEWIQIRNRSGQPVEGVVALPVKDPFHILRTVMYMTEDEEKTDELPTID